MSDGHELLSIFHFTVHASNFERSLEFYEAIGFKLLRDNRDVVWPTFVAANFGMERAQGRGALLAIDDGADHTRLDLIEWVDPVDPGPSPGSPPRIMALRTKNVVAAYETLSAKGISFIREPYHPDPDLGVVGVVCCTDPDGLVVEFIEYADGVLGSRVESLPTR